MSSILKLPESVSESHVDRKYGSYQTAIYASGFLEGNKPIVTTDPRKLRAQAKARLSENAFNYVAGGAGELSTMEANRLAFRQWKLVPRMLRPSTPTDLTVTLFGKKYDSPILMAPVGVQSIFHADKETGLSQVCSEIGVPYILSTASTSSIEEVATSSGSGHRWFQLYWPEDNEVTISLLDRAAANGFTVLVVTLDTWQLSWRPADLDNAYMPFLSGIGNRIGFTDPVFRAKFEAKHQRKVEDDISAASREWLADVFPGKSHTWEDIARLREHWKGAIVLKGIQHVEDARLAVAAGCDGIVVSNHGGRQLDGALGSLDALPGIVDAVGSQVTVLFDSGIRTGVDVLKALCLGAKACLIGRPAVYGLAVNGKEGAKAVLQGILADLDHSMGLAGIKSIPHCTRDLLSHVTYGGDIASCV